jgi:hypothetical protein
MRNYATISPAFWTGNTGKKICASGAQSQVLALYLISGPATNMIGLYYLPLTTISHDTGIPLEGVSKGLHDLERIGFAKYDKTQETIYVLKMVEFQVGTNLGLQDKRCRGVWNELKKYRKSRFFNDFHKRYQEHFYLPNLASDQSEPQGAWKPLRSQEQEQEQEQKERKERKPAGSPASRGLGSLEKAKGRCSDWEVARRKLILFVKRMPVEEKRNAKTFHDSIHDYLALSLRLNVEREYLVEDCGDGRPGHIDLVVTAPFKAAIELDRLTPRKRSLAKIAATGWPGIVLCRESKSAAPDPNLRPLAERRKAGWRKAG